jgi:hypothetical protein
MNFLHHFNLPTCGLDTCTKCSTVPSWYPEEQYALLTQYLVDPVSTPVENLDPHEALKKIKYTLEDIMENMNVTSTVHCHEDGTDTVVEGPNIKGSLYHLFNSLRNILIAAGMIPLEYNDSVFLEQIGIDPDSIVFENFLDDFLSQDNPYDDE